MAASPRALFLDRDGVINELVYYASAGEWEGPRTVRDVALRPGAANALERARAAGWKLFIVSNQPSFAKGKTSLEALQAVDEAIRHQLGVPLDASYYCFHHPEAIVDELRVACECRKPGVLFLHRAARDHGVDLAASWMIGDQDSDLRAGRTAGCRVALVENPHSAPKRGGVEPDLRCETLSQCIDWILLER